MTNKKKGLKSKPRWMCKPNCCECCSSHIKFPRSLVEKHRTEFQVEPDLTYIGGLRGDTQVYTNDAYCVFLNRTKGKCAIYEDRPLQCRLFGIDPRQPCPYVRPDGSYRNAEEIAKNQALIDNAVKFVQREMLGNGKKEK